MTPNVETEYRVSPRVVLRPGDKFKVAAGPYYRLADGTKVNMAARGTFTLLAVEQRRGRVTLLAYGRDGYAALHVAGRRRSRVPGLVARPYRVKRAGGGRKNKRLDPRRADA